MCIKVQKSDIRKSLLHSLVKVILTWLQLKFSHFSDLFIRGTEKIIPDKWSSVNNSYLHLLSLGIGFT